jgi:hypothetical protein
VATLNSVFADPMAACGTSAKASDERAVNWSDLDAPEIARRPNKMMSGVERHRADQHAHERTPGHHHAKRGDAEVGGVHQRMRAATDMGREHHARNRRHDQQDRQIARVPSRRAG